MELYDIDLSWSESDLKVFLPVILGTISFMLFWFPWKSEKIKQRYFQKYGERGSEKFVMMTKYLGGISMGLLPLAGCLIAFPDTGLTDYGFGMSTGMILPTILFTVALSLILVPVAILNAKKPANWLNYPQIRTKVWDKKLKFTYAWGWMVYLFGYEALFRGVLFFPLYETIGLWPAIAVNVALYSATHIPKGLNETIGTFPLSIVLCLITAATGNFWAAFFAHVAIAWANSFASMKFNPEISGV